MLLRTAAIILATVVFSKASLAADASPGVSGRETSEPVAIGLMASLTGDAALIGKQCQDGFNAASADFSPGGKAGKTRVKFILADHRGDGRTAVTEFHRLAETENVAAIVTHFSQSTMQINPLSMQQRIPLLSAVAHSEFISSNPYAFRFFPSAGLESGALNDLLRGWNISGPALLTVQDEYALSLRAALLLRLRERKIEPIADFDIGREETDLNSIVTKVLAGRPDLVFLNVAIPQLVPLAKKLRSSGYRGRLAGNVWLAFQNAQELARSGDLDGAAFAMLDSSVLKKAADGVNSTATPPAEYACYSAVAALLQAISSIDGTVDRQSIYQSLGQLKSVTLPGETVPLVNRELQFRLKIATYRNGILGDEK